LGLNFLDFGEFWTVEGICGFTSGEATCSGVGALLTFYLCSTHNSHTEIPPEVPLFMTVHIVNAMIQARGAHAKKHVQGRSDTQVQNHGSLDPGSIRISIS
jgi:hypothetical protein